MDHCAILQALHAKFTEEGNTEAADAIHLAMRASGCIPNTEGGGTGSGSGGPGGGP